MISLAPPRIALTRRTLLLASTFLVPATAALANVEVYKDRNAPIEARVRDLLGRMTLEEKTAQMRCLWSEKSKLINREDGRFSRERAREAIANGIGQIGRPSDTVGMARPSGPHRGIDDTVAFVNAVQRFLVEETRLGIPALFHEETAHGYAALGATIFPIPPALASTWDPALVEQVFAVAGREARVRGATIALSPVVDLMREPRFGRSEEFFSEDPYLTAQMGAAAVRGQQGRTRPLARDKLFVTLKHFVHGAPEGGLNLAPADISDRTLWETYLPPFIAGVEADAAIIMPSYNEVQGVPSHASVDLLQDVGRQKLGFHGAYFSDYGGIANLATHHHVAADQSEAAVLAINAGVDADLPEGECYAHLAELVRAGRVEERRIDAAVARILSLKFEAGLFENPYVDSRRAVRETNTPADIRLARTVAEKSIILLKNDGVLPLNPAANLKLAVIGPNAAQPMFGGYSGVNDKAVSILAGIRAAAGPNMIVEHADGVWITQPLRPGQSPFGPVRPASETENRSRIESAVALAQRSDMVLLVIGDNEQVTRESVSPFSPGDRNSLDLFGQQNALVDAVLATGKPVVALLINGRPLAVTQLAAHANALLEGWYLGQEGGNAFAKVLFGRSNPSGKLTVSIPRALGDLPVYYNRHPSADINQFVEGRKKPLFPFGHGLSYTTFTHSAPRLSATKIGANDAFSVEVDIANTGGRAGDEVVQLYIRDEVSSAPRPVLELKAFRRITLRPGERRTVRFDLGPDALAFQDTNMQRRVEPGAFNISTGPSSAILQSVRLTVRPS